MLLAIKKNKHKLQSTLLIEEMEIFHLDEHERLFARL